MYVYIIPICIYIYMCIHFTICHHRSMPYLHICRPEAVRLLKAATYAAAVDPETGAVEAATILPADAVSYGSYGG